MFYGVFSQDLAVCDAMQVPAQVNACRDARNAEAQAVRAGLAVGAILGAAAAWFYMRKG